MSTPTKPDDLGKVIIDNITDGLNFTLPEIDLTDPKWELPDAIRQALQEVVNPVTLESLTEKKIDGNGAMDTIMSFASAHLLGEFKAGRITGTDYSKAYTSVITAAMQTGLQFALEANQARFNAIMAQVNANASLFALESAKAAYLTAKANALTAEAQYANHVMDLSIKDSNYGISQYNLKSVLPQQLILTKEQTEAARAQTMDTRTDGTPILGSVGKQKELYSQQITSYKRSAETNAAKILSDAFITMKTIDEGLPIPPAFQATEISNAVNMLMYNNQLRSTPN